jgi:hypothetical protein
MALFALFEPVLTSMTKGKDDGTTLVEAVVTALEVLVNEGLYVKDAELSVTIDWGDKLGNVGVDILEKLFKCPSKIIVDVK